MKETPAQHAARTGRAYRPAVAGARPLADDEPCPTLFRYPGPVALHETLSRGLPPLAAPGSAVIWLSSDPRAAAPAALFGTLAVLEPLLISPAVLGDAYVAAAQPVEAVWVPPSALDRDWDAVTAVDEHADERARVLDELGAYLEEMSALARAGAPPPPGAWCQVPAPERARLLAERGLAARWTRL